VKNALARQVGKQPPHCGPFVMVVVRAHIGVADVLQGRVVVSLPSHRHLRRRSPTIGGFWHAWNTRPTHGTSQTARVQSNGAPGRNRTCYLMLRRDSLCQRVVRLVVLNCSAARSQRISLNYSECRPPSFAGDLPRLAPTGPPASP